MDNSNLTDIYDKGVGPDDPVYVPTPKSPAINPNRHDFARLSPYDPDEYTGHMPEGLVEAKGNPDFRLGELQSTADKWGNFLGRLVPKVGTGLIEGLGYMGALATEHRDDRDYSNSLIEWAQSANESIDKTLPLYRKDNDVISMGDASWWLGNLEGLTTSVASFALEGAGLAKVLGGLGKLAKMGGAGAKTLKGINMANEVLTAGGMAYVEGAQIGNSVYKRTYEAQMQRLMNSGMDYEAAHKEANRMAAQSAATTVQMNVIMNTGLNMYSILPFFGNPGVHEGVEKFARSNFRRMGNETLEQTAERIKGYDFKKLAKELVHTEGATAMIREAAFEGIEEINNQFAERTGLQLGKDNKTKGLLQQFTELEHYFSRTMDQEGALSFVLGALAGPATNLVTTRMMKIHKGIKYDENGVAQTYNDKDGKVVAQTQRYTSRALTKYGTQNYFNNIKSQLVNDIGELQKKTSELQSAKTPEEAARIQDELFAVGAYNAVRMGMADNLIASFESIRDLDNTTPEKAQAADRIEAIKQELAGNPPSAAELQVEMQDLIAKYNNTPVRTQAMRLGFAKDENDMSYKTKAQRSIDDLKELDKIHKEVFDKYSTLQDVTGEDKRVPELVDFLFNRKANMYLQKRRLDEHAKAIDQFEAENDTKTVTLSQYQKESNQWAADQKAREAVVERIDNEIALLTRAVKTKDQATIDRLLSKYAAIGMTSEDDPAAVADLHSRLLKQKSKHERAVAAHENDLFISVGYDQWLERKKADPNMSEQDRWGMFQEYYNDVLKNAALKEHVQQLRVQHADGIRILEEHEAQYEKMTSLKGVKKFVNSIETWKKDLQDTWDKEAKNKAVEKALSAKDKNLKQQLDKAEHHRLAQVYAEQLNAVRKQIVEKNKELAKAVEAWDKWIEKNPMRRIVTFNSDKRAASGAKGEELTNAIDTINSELDALKAKELKLETLYLQEDELFHSINVHPINQDEEPVDPDPALVGEHKPEKLTPEEVVKAEAEAAADKVPTTPTFDEIAANGILPYIEAIKQLSPADRARVEQVELMVRTGKVPFSLDLLPSLVNGPAIMQLMQEGMVALNKWEKQAVPAEEVPAMPVEPMSVLTGDLEAVIHRPLVENTVEGNELYSLQANAKVGTMEHTGIKRKNTATAVAMNTLAYTPFRNATTKKFGKVSKVDEINPNSYDILNPNRLTAGTKLTVEPDLGYEGQILYDYEDMYDEYGNQVQRNVTAEEYFNQDGTIKVGKEMEVPFVIKDGNGQVVGYVHRGPWVDSQFVASGANPESFNNTAEEDVRKQMEMIASVRFALVKEWNKSKTAIKTVVTSKGPGTVIWNVEMTGAGTLDQQGKRFVWKPARAKDRSKSMLPGRLTIGIHNDGVIRTGLNSTVPNFNKVSYLKQAKNVPVAMLPMANGSYTPVPLVGKELYSFNQNDRVGDGALHSLVHAINLYLNNPTQTEAIDKLQQETGAAFSIGTAEGLRDFIHQYWTYTQKISDSELSIANTKAKMSWKLEIGDPAPGELIGKIRIGRVGSGQSAIEATSDGTTLNPKFVEALKQLLSTRQRVITFTRDRVIGLNSAKEFVHPQADVNGNWKYTKYENYNEYVKSFSFTNVYGRNQGPDGKYIYSANPDIQFDSEAFGAAQSIEANITDNEFIEALDSEGLDLLNTDDAIFNSIIGHKKPVTNGIEGKKLSIEALTELLNFTPPQNRNGKTVEQVYRELTIAGWDTLPVGFEPFFRCG